MDPNLLNMDANQLLQLLQAYQQLNHAPPAPTPQLEPGPAPPMPNQFGPQMPDQFGLPPQGLNPLVGPGPAPPFQMPNQFGLPNPLLNPFLEPNPPIPFGFLQPNRVPFPNPDPPLLPMDLSFLPTLTLSRLANQPMIPQLTSEEAANVLARPPRSDASWSAHYPMATRTPEDVRLRRVYEQFNTWCREINLNQDQFKTAITTLSTTPAQLLDMDNNQLKELFREARDQMRGLNYLEKEKEDKLDEILGKVWRHVPDHVDPDVEGLVKGIRNWLRQSSCYWKWFSRVVIAPEKRVPAFRLNADLSEFKTMTCRKSYFLKLHNWMQLDDRDKQQLGRLVYLKNRKARRPAIPANPQPPDHARVNELLNEDVRNYGNPNEQLRQIDNWTTNFPGGIFSWVDVVTTLLGLTEGLTDEVRQPDYFFNDYTLRRMYNFLGLDDANKEHFMRTLVRNKNGLNQNQ
uniref:Gag_p30 domain-containing protein n=1 Tax=Caenorhabditis tropicalis TaxID=1561998 RepID=A0A1I7UVE6_9PELO